MVDAITFIRTEEQTMLGATVREMLDANVDFDQTRDMSTTDDAFDRRVWDGLVEMGLLGLHIPEEYGGAGFNATEVAVVSEELGRFVAAVPFVSSVASATALLSGGSDDLKASVLPGLADGSVIGTLAVYESAHGDAHCRHLTHRGIRRRYDADRNETIRDRRRSREPVRSFGNAERCSCVGGHRRGRRRCNGDPAPCPRRHAALGDCRVQWCCRRPGSSHGECRGSPRPMRSAWP